MSGCQTELAQRSVGFINVRQPDSPVLFVLRRKTGVSLQRQGGKGKGAWDGGGLIWRDVRHKQDQ